MSREKPSAFVDALPDLTIGLIGIPVAMSLQSVVEAIAKSSKDAAAWFYQGEGLFYFVFILGMYGILSVGLLMLFEADRANLRDDDDDEVWQRKLITRLAVLVGPLTLATACLMLLGQSYKSDGNVTILCLKLTPEILAFGVGALNLFFVVFPLVWPNSAAQSRFRITLPYYYLVSCCLLGSPLALF